MKKSKGMTLIELLIAMGISVLIMAATFIIVRYSANTYDDTARMVHENNNSYDAISVINGVAVVCAADCVGCAICVKTCPNHIISLHTLKPQAMVLCSNRDKGAVTRKACTSGCIGCKKCEKTCEYGAIKVADNFAQIDYSKCTGCGKCAEVCTVGSIIITGKK